KRANFAGSLFAGRVRGLDNRAGRGTARAHDQPGPLMADLIFLKPGVHNRLLHGNVVPCRTGTHETAYLPVDLLFPIERWCAMDLAAEASFGIILCSHDAGFRFA